MRIHSPTLPHKPGKLCANRPVSHLGIVGNDFVGYEAPLQRDIRHTIAIGVSFLEDIIR